jgi:hypothetical protein
MSYLAWFDNTKNKPLMEKIEEGAERYREKTGRKPTVVLVNEAQADARPRGIEVKVPGYVRPDNFWFGEE